MKINQKYALLTALVLFTISCAVKKENAVTLTTPPDDFRGSTVTDSTQNSGRLNYKDFYKDATLINLIEKAFAQNQDLQIALKQLEINSLSVKQSKWNNIPQIDANLATASITRPSDNSLNGLMFNQFLGNRYIEDYSSSLNISWEADIWGKIKSQKDKALVEYLKSEEATKAVQSQLIQQVATGYYNLLMLDKQFTVASENLTLADSTLTILKKEFDLGMITSLVVEQQEIVKNQIEKNIPVIEEAINSQENALSYLCGEYPTKIERSQSLDNVAFPEAVETGIPSQLLENRPDVKSAELDYRNSVLDVRIAKANLYPSLTISGQGGLNSFISSNWFNIPGSLFAMGSGSLLQPVLRGKALKTRYKQSKIQTEQAEIRFKQTMLRAVEEVSNALVLIEKLDQQQVFAEQLVVKSNSVFNNSLTLFKYNEATSLDVITAQNNKLQAELDLATVKTQRLNAIATLYAALGGGWQ